MDDDLAIAKVLEARKLELKTGASALVRRLRQLEKRGRKLQTELEDLVGSPELLDEVEALDEDKRACYWQLYTLTADAIGTDYTAVDVASWCQRAVEMRASHPRLNTTVLDDLINVRIVPNVPFREWVERYLKTPDASMRAVVVAVHRQLEAVEREMGQNHGSASLFFGRFAQARILKRWLGMEVAQNGRSASVSLFVSYERALALQRAFDLTPHQAGI